MKNNEIIGLVLAVLIVIGGIIGYNYMEIKDNVIMANSGLEQCPKTPDWKGSPSIWVKDCSKYLKLFDEINK